ncbi:nucleolar protein 12 [Tympanuchus pallidicinctus]|uniref:nucleolar protein 12 n=1 Tax=Tympanuchus pallidicinctus TaxID=109042 RepID=UPI0022873D88|nr:nucleolar protein 12 [Tympanuchus pallidicinctus]
MGRKKKKKGSGSAASRLVVTFDEERRREYLTGFHKRKVERRKVALEEIKRKLKEEQRKMKEERHKEYLKMLREREEALDEFDELEHLVTSRTESVNIDHPNHIVTVTTISDLDLSGARQLGLTTSEGKSEEEEKGEEVVNKPARTMPKKSRNPFLSEKISSLTATLHMHSRKKKKGKRPQRGQGSLKKIQKPSMRRTTKTQRRRLTGKMGRDQD